MQAKDVLIHLFKNANNFDWSDEELDSKLFGEKQDGIIIHQYDDSVFGWSRILD